MPSQSVGRLEGKTAIVFGAGSVGEGWGNGKACAVAYACEGARVVAVDRDIGAAQATCGHIEAEGGTGLAVQADVTERDQITAAVGVCAEAFGAVDVLHNNVGIVMAGGIAELSLEAWEQSHAVNLRGMLLTCQAVLPGMLERGRGAIVNVSSMASLRWNGYPYVAYSVSKAGVNQLTRSIAMQYADRGIRANAILPGKIDTPHIYQGVAGFYPSRDEMRRARAQAVPMKRMGDAWDVAAAAVFLASDQAKFITGVLLPVDGGAHCAGP